MPLLLLLLAPACAGRDIPLVDAGIPDWVCQKPYRLGEDFFWVSRIVDGAGAPKALTARWRSRDSELAWRIPDSGAWYERPTELRAQIELDDVPGETVSTRLYADGVLVDEREQLSRRAARRYPRGARVLLAASVFGSAKVPKLHGIRDLRMRAVGAGGRVIAEALLPLPDWSVVDRYVEEGRREVDLLADDFVAGCEQQTGGEI
jgi:hypothetical protein